MKHVEAEKPSISFVPSAVTGLSGVKEVEITSTEIAFRSDSGTHTYPYNAFARYEKRPFARLYRRPTQGIVGVLHFDRSTYQNSYFRLFTSPEITVYMPTEGPSRYPESAFWRVQNIVAAGNVRFIDPSMGELAIHPLDEGPRWARVIRNVLFGVGFINFALFWIIGVCLGGVAESHDGKSNSYYLTNDGHRKAVSRDVWNYSHWHERSVFITHPMMFVGVGIWAFARNHSKRMTGKGHFGLPADSNRSNG